MRIAVALGILLLSVLPNVSFADKVTYDPNLIKSSPAAKSATDKRLEQKITYTAKNKRLHTILEEISKETGVVIRCGRDAKDWQIRDLPVFVSVYDIQLGNLLDYISNVTHLLLSSTMVNDKPQYRIWLDASGKKEIQDYFTQKKARALAKANWVWDAWVRLGKIPAAELGNSVVKRTSPVDGVTHPDDNKIEASIAFANLMAQLPAEVKEKVFNFECVRIDVNNATAGLYDQLKTFYRNQWESQMQVNEEMALKDPEYAKYFSKREFKESNLDKLSLVLDLSDEKTPRINAKVESSFMDSCGFSMDSVTVFDHKALGKVPESVMFSEEPGCSRLPGFEKVSCDEGSEDKLSKFKIQKLSSDKEMLFADRLAVVSSASEYSIICEDFLSNQNAYNSSFCEEKATLAEHLDTISNDINWCINSSEKVAIGSSATWRDHHLNLMPESLVNTLRQKINSSGAELDDVVPLVNYNLDQLSEWVLNSKDMSIYIPLTDDDKAFWRLYDSFSSADKALAKTENGISLAKFDPRLTSVIFSKAAYEAKKLAVKGGEMISLGKAMMSNPELMQKVTQWIMQQHPEIANNHSEKPATDPDFIEQLLHEIQQQFPELTEQVYIPTDPYQISELKLRVVEESSGEAKRSKFHSYTMKITGDGVNINVGSPSYSFPIYSKKREAQLAKEPGIGSQQKDSSAESK